jgi:cytochrome oxidase assembly protein ShyY1
MNSNQSNAAAERSAHVTRGELAAPATWPAVQLPDGTWQLRRIVELEKSIESLAVALTAIVLLDSDNGPYAKIARAALEGKKDDQ